MKKYSFVYVLSLVLVVGSQGWVSAALKGKTDAAAEHFFYRCAGCHTIGEGALSGPDLKTVRTWSDADLTAAVTRMQKNTGPLSKADIQEMVRFLKDMNAGQRIKDQKGRLEAKARSELPAPSYDRGQRLFRGQKPLANGGLACISCHRFVDEGGSLGPDLTRIKEHLQGAALRSGIENAGYKVMRSIYKDRKITRQEALHLAEYLSRPEEKKKRFAPTVGTVGLLAIIGVGGCLAGIGVLNRRRKGSTRKRFLQQHLKR